MRLVLCDPHTMFTDALNMGLARGGHLVVAETEDSDEVVALVVRLEPDVCVLDLGTRPGSASLTATLTDLRERAPGVRVLLLTDAATDDVWAAYDAGLVDGVVNKTCDMAVLTRAIERVHAGTRVIERFARPTRPRAIPMQRSHLSERERAVVTLLAGGASTEEMAAELGVSTQTVRTHVQSVLRRFGVNSRSRAVSIALDLGAVTVEASDNDGWRTGSERDEGTVQAAWEHPVSVLVVDDHRVFADALAGRLAAEDCIREVEVAGSLNEARAKIRRACPDLVMLDFQLGDERGTDLLAELATLPDAPSVLMLSGNDRAKLAVQALEGGAQGWISKTATFDTLMFAAREVAQGRLYLSRASLKPVLDYLLSPGAGQGPPSFLDGLSARQTEVLRCVVSGMSRAECADRLNLSVHTVRTHVQHLLKQAEVHSTLALAARARALGVHGIDELTRLT